MRKAQEELDKVVGSDRMPDFSDQLDLPYTSAIVKEVLRWGCPLPIGVPKQVTVDDIYNGQYIPAGATIIENIWWVVVHSNINRPVAGDGAQISMDRSPESYRAMFHDESTYSNPHAYNPERYLEDGKFALSVKDPEEVIFGFGRRCCWFSDGGQISSILCWNPPSGLPHRICPGQHFAMRTLFLNIACTLTLFNIEAPDEKLEAKFSEGVVRCVTISRVVSSGCGWCAFEGSRFHSSAG
jgi:cytochrome P450